MPEYVRMPPLSRQELLLLSKAAAAVKLRGGIRVNSDGLTGELLSALRMEQREELIALAASDFVDRPTSWQNIRVLALRKGKGNLIFQNRLIAHQSTAHQLYLGALKNAIYGENLGQT